MLFTFILNYNNRTAVKQVAADDLAEALTKWQEVISDTKVGQLGETFDFAESMKNDRLVLLKSLEKVHATAFQLGRGDATLYVVSHG